MPIGNPGHFTAVPTRDLQLSQLAGNLLLKKNPPAKPARHWLWGRWTILASLNFFNPGGCCARWCGQAECRADSTHNRCCLILSDPEIITDFAQNGVVTGALAPLAQDHRSFRHQSWQDVPNVLQALCSSSIAAGLSGDPPCWGPPGPWVDDDAFSNFYLVYAQILA